MSKLFHSLLSRGWESAAGESPALSLQPACAVAVPGGAGEEVEARWCRWVCPALAPSPRCISLGTTGRTLAPWPTSSNIKTTLLSFFTVLSFEVSDF